MMKVKSVKNLFPFITTLVILRLVLFYFYLVKWELKQKMVSESAQYAAEIIFVRQIIHYLNNWIRYYCTFQMFWYLYFYIYFLIHSSLHKFVFVKNRPVWQNICLLSFLPWVLKKIKTSTQEDWELVHSPSALFTIHRNATDV